MRDAPLHARDLREGQAGTATGSPRTGRRLPCRLGRYTLFDRIGRGGMADIYLAREVTDLGASRLLVVKEVAPKLAGKPEFAEMLAGEARLAARLQHASIAQVEDLGRDEEALFIAMEYVEGLDLRELLRRAARQRVPVPVEFSLFVVAETLRALSYAHRMGVLHRDVSPSNVLLSFEGEVKLCDFGIARAHQEVAREASGNGAVALEEALQGKAGYMSPEHARGEVVDARADVFAAGILLWELLSGRKLYRADGFEALLELAKRADIAPPPPLRLPDEAVLHAITLRALEPRRDDRYGSAAEMLGDLTRYAASANLVANPLRMGEWLREYFSEEILAVRRSRQRALRALDMGPPAVIEAIALPVTPTPAPVSGVQLRARAAEAGADAGEPTGYTPVPPSGVTTETRPPVSGSRPSLLRRALALVGMTIG
ncbi:serine/threonine-protein kinase [Chondromyces apiculatus]|nr:serine/threonine-protein kinase [Chondromyces apiculatus]